LDLVRKARHSSDRRAGSYHTYTALDFPVSLGAYQFPSKPEEPPVLFMLRTPCRPGLPMRDQLARMLGDAGFDPARDIEGITVNRWRTATPTRPTNFSIRSGNPRRKNPG
jgi:spermidine dehydrogenase